MNDVIIRNDALQLVLKQDQGRLQVALVNLASSRVWGPVPLVALEVYDKPLKRVERVTDWRVERVDPITDGVAVRACDPNRALHPHLSRQARRSVFVREPLGCHAASKIIGCRGEGSVPRAMSLATLRAMPCQSVTIRLAPRS